MILQTDSAYFESVIKNDPGFALLSAKTAGLVISFFHQEFILYNRISVFSADMENHLVSFLKDHKEEQAEFDKENGEDDEENRFIVSNTIQKKVRAYIEKWCKKGYLLRYYNADRESVLELTPSITKLFNWIDGIKPKKFVGTESQFKTILDQMQDLYQHINEDAEARLKSLEKEKAEIEKEIERLKNGGKVQTYTPIQMYESLELILKNGKSLINDFREVDDNFRKTGTEIYKKQSEINTTKGEILGFALDTDEKLRSSPQGQSFEAFWKYIASDSDNEINTIVNALIEKSAEFSQIGTIDNIDTDFLLNFKKNLFEAGSKIIETKRSITDKLSRVLQQNQNQDYQKLNSLISDIKTIAAKKFSSDSYENKKDFMMFDRNAILSRSFVPVLPSMQSDFAEMEKFDSSELGESDFEDLLTQFYVDRNLLLNHIESYRKEHDGQFTLSGLLKEFPLEKGMAELASYYDMLNTEDGFTVDENSKELVQYKSDGCTVQVCIPKLIIRGR